MSDTVLGVQPLDAVWSTADPFLFCVHHLDSYPAGNERFGPAASLAGRNIGMDFDGKDGWRMYHGDVVPGFPQHPHRGFETVTIARQGRIDHADSLGAAARFGNGDVQWLTAGAGIVHSEMFPLLHQDRANPTELFQIWLNLPSASKMVKPYFSMLWAEDIPIASFSDSAGGRTEVTVVAGTLGEAKPPAPPPDSWASRPGSGVAIWSIVMAPGARWTLPAADAGLSRTLYLFGGGPVSMDGQNIRRGNGVSLHSDRELALVAGEEASELLLLQARPIGEPVAHHGPFVMNTREELQRTFADYQRTRFGGWPWPTDAPVHPRDAGRFARHVDGRVEKR